VPPEALSGLWQMQSFHGVCYVSFDSFKAWMARGGASARERALHDERTFESAMLPNRVLVLRGVDPWRVKDLAYQLLNEDWGRAITFIDGYGKRDQLIADYLRSEAGR